jgi:hypothetical protein
MAERLAPLPDTLVRSPVKAGRTISAKKVLFFYNHALGTRSQALQLRLWIGSKFAVAKVFLHLEALVHVGRRIPHSKDSQSLLMVQ